VVWVGVEHRTENFGAISMLSRNMYTCLLVVILSLQGSAEIADKVNDKSIQGIIRSLISKRVGPTFSAGQTMQGRTVAHLRKKTDISASAIEHIQHLDGRLFERSTIMDRGPGFGIWRIHK
jgi:hypothetical protein